MAQSYRFAQDGTPADARRDARNLIAGASALQRAKEKADALAGLQAQRQQLVQAGVMESSLPVVHGSLSAQDMVAAQRRLNMLGGMSPSQAQQPRAPFVPSSNPVDDVARLGTQLMVGGMPADQMRSAVDARRLQLGLPSSTEAEKSMVVGNAVTTGALTGKTIQTPYGDVSSRGPTWQENLVKLHPEIGQAGTQANAEFVKAYKAAQAGGDDVEKDPLKIGANVMSSIRTPADPMAPGGPQFRNPVEGLDVKNPELAPALAEVPFAGFDVGEANWTPIKTPADPSSPGAIAQAAGVKVKEGLSGTLYDVDRWGANNILRPVVNTAAAGVDAVRGFFTPAGETPPTVGRIGVTPPRYSPNAAPDFPAMGLPGGRPGGTGGVTSPLPYRPVAAVEPVELPPYQWSTAAKPKTPGLALGTAPVTSYSAGSGVGAGAQTRFTHSDFFGKSGTDDFSKFRENPFEAEYEKRLKGPFYANDGR